MIHTYQKATLNFEHTCSPTGVFFSEGGGKDFLFDGVEFFIEKGCFRCRNYALRHLCGLETDADFLHEKCEKKDDAKDSRARQHESNNRLHAWSCVWRDFDKSMAIFRRIVTALAKQRVLWDSAI